MIIKRRENKISDIDEQNSFRADRLCSDNLFCLNQLLEKMMARNLKTHMIFIALEKPYRIANYGLQCWKRV